MNAQQRYYQLKDLSECKWREAQEMVSREEERQNHIRNGNHGDISKEDQAEWMRVLADAYSLQQEAIKLEAEAAEAQVEAWRIQYAFDNDYHELIMEQEELRGQL